MTDRKIGSHIWYNEEGKYYFSDYPLGNFYDSDYGGDTNKAYSAIQKAKAEYKAELYDNESYITSYYYSQQQNAELELQDATRKYEESVAKASETIQQLDTQVNQMREETINLDQEVLDMNQSVLDAIDDANRARELSENTNQQLLDIQSQMETIGDDLNMAILYMQQAEQKSKETKEITDKMGGWNIDLTGGLGKVAIGAGIAGMAIIFVVLIIAVRT